MKITVEERGWAGHFICADKCMFHRNTLVSWGEKKIVVSSVGRYFPYGLDKSVKEEEIGYHRFYETMMFWAEKDKDGYWDAQVSKQLYAGEEIPWAVEKMNSQSDKLANDIHEQNVRWVIDNIKTLKENENE